MDINNNNNNDTNNVIINQSVALTPYDNKLLPIPSMETVISILSIINSGNSYDQQLIDISKLGFLALDEAMVFMHEYLRRVERGRKLSVMKKTVFFELEPTVSNPQMYLVKNNFATLYKGNVDDFINCDSVSIGEYRTIDLPRLVKVEHVEFILDDANNHFPGVLQFAISEGEYYIYDNNSLSKCRNIWSTTDVRFMASPEKIKAEAKLNLKKK